MKRVTLNLLAVMMVLTGISAALASTPNADGTKKMVLKPKASGWILVQCVANRKVTVTAKADHGKVHIRIVNGKGKTVARGVGKVTFNSGKKKMTCKAQITNKTNKIQKVTTSMFSVVAGH